MDLKEAFGEVLRECRNETGTSQEQLALQSELDRTFISKMERGLNQPTLETIFTIAKILQCPPSELVRRVEHKISVS